MYTCANFCNSLFYFQSTTGYESIYEPISPRPGSQMSSARGSNSGGVGGYGPTSSMYAGSSNGGHYPPDRGAAPPPQGGKEAEVDALTSMLVQSMESRGDPEFFGGSPKKQFASLALAGQ